MTHYLNNAALPSSYYEASIAPRPSFPRLENDLKVDVCIIGGGFAGLHTARQLHARGITTTIIDAHDIGWGASGRNGGHLIPEFACGMGPIERALGLADSLSLWHLLQDSAQDVRDLAQECQADYQTGHIEAALTARQSAALMQQREYLNTHYHARLEALDADALYASIGSRAYRAGIFNPNGGHLHPLKLLLGLAQQLNNQGHQIYTHTPAISINSRSNAHTILTPHAQIHAKSIVLTCNVGIAQVSGAPFLRALQQRILPVGTWLITTAVLPPDLQQAILPKRAAVVDTRIILDYYRMSPSGRLIFGGGCSYLGHAAPKGFVQEMRRNMTQIFPALTQTPIEYQWGGVIDISFSRAPILGQVLNTASSREGIYYAMGFSGSGIVATAALARVIASTLSGSTRTEDQTNHTNFSRLSALRNRAFPFGRYLRAPMTALGMAYYRWRDH